MNMKSLYNSEDSAFSDLCAKINAQDIEMNTWQLKAFVLLKILIKQRLFYNEIINAYFLIKGQKQ
ncbi:hypothetical protein TEHSL10_05050 [Tetragenococcus halophilus]|nr:hypothetical protein TEHSL10_05050 [Tetragenococcus halophilus]